MIRHKYIVTERWEQSYPDPILLEKGERVIVDFSIKDDTPGWDNWVWCISAKRQSGWVPTQILQMTASLNDDKKEAVVIEDYSANELSVEKDQVFIGEKILNGWIWGSIENTDLKGWVPLVNIKQII